MSETAEPICRHFGTCGGCSFQDMPTDGYLQMKTRFVAGALAREGVACTSIEDTRQIAPGTRRRATFKAAKINGETRLGFHAAASHTIVDMLECRVLTPRLANLVPGLREMMASRLKDGEKAELHVIEVENGFDVSLGGMRTDASLTAWAARWAAKLHVVRVTAEREVLVELAAPAVTFGDAAVRLPPDAFLQPTREGERFLQERVLEAGKGGERIVELFCGVGTFALCLARFAPVHAIDADTAALAALAAAARATQGLKPVTTQARDLFRSPLTFQELAAFDVAVLDPPRAGASRQARELARSKVQRVVYVSCNPQSFAHDARLLLEGGYRLGTVTPVDQFVWSSHIELVADFSQA